MGKYMRKAKVTGEVAVMEVVAQSTIGVRTRAKTLALQRLQKISSSPTTTTTTSTTAAAAAASTDTDNNNNNNNSGGSSYFQLRSRKLERPPLIVVDSSSKKQTQAKEVSCKKNPNPKLRTSPRFVVGTVNSGSVGSVNLSCSKNYDENERIQEKKNYDDLCLEASFGENVLDIEERDRNTRETTPCSLIRDPDTIRTPGSSTRPTTLSNRRMRNPMRGNIPTTREMDEFFANAEQQQQRFFTEKYNFDPVNDLPLPGRYEWVSVDL